MPTANTTGEIFRRLPYVKKKYGDVGTSTVYRWVAAKKFPAPVKLGPGTVAWRDSELASFDADPEGWAANAQEG